MASVSSGVPGSKSIAGHSTVHNGTWESHVVLEGSPQSGRTAGKRQGGGMVVWQSDRFIVEA